MDAQDGHVDPPLKIIFLLGGLLTAACILIYVISPSFVTFLNYRLGDAVCDRTPPAAGSDAVVVVAIDEQSLERFGQWPWPRYRLAQLVEKAGQLGAASIGLDFIMAEPDRLSLQTVLEAVRRDMGHEVEIRSAPGEIKDNDALLTTVLSRWPSVLGFKFLFDAAGGDSACHLHPVNTARASNALEKDNHGSFPQATGVVCNLAPFCAAVSTSGFLNGVPDLDGVLRRVPLVIRYGEAIYPSLALATVMNASKTAAGSVVLNGGGEYSLRTANHAIPMDARGNLSIFFPKAAGRIPQISASDLLTGQTPAEAVNARMVFIGLTAAGLGPMFHTPAGAGASAVQVHAQAAETIVAKSYIRRFPDVILLEVALTLLLTAFLCLGVARWGFLTTSIVGALGVTGVWLGSLHVFQTSRLLVSPLLPAAALIVNGIGLTTFKYWRQQRAARVKAADALFLLKSSEHRLNAIIKTIPDIVFRLDAAGRITFISPAVLKYEKRPEELLGKHILEIVHPEDRGAATYRINERRTGARATSDVELRLLLSQNDRPEKEPAVFFSISAEGVYTGRAPDRGSFLGTQGIARDISKRKQLEYQLERSQKMEAIGNLAAGVAHDLNNILSGIFSYPELMLIDLPKDSPLRSGLEIIQKSGQKAAAIVQDMLNLARRGAGLSEIVSLNTVIAEFLSAPEFKRIQETHPQVRVKTDLSPDLMNVRGSKVHLTKVVMNLILNAAEAMPVGGAVTILTRNRYFDTGQAAYEVIPEGEYVEVSITDEGVGIAAHDLTRIFEPFYSRKKMGQSGTGLGMTVVWATVKDHKGYIDLHSREGQGTRFDIFFPATRDTAAAENRYAVLQDYIGTEHILVVDDVAEQREITEGMLKRLGYRVASVGSGEAAVDYLRSNPVDLLVLDMIMEPGIDGLETYRRIISIRPGQKAIVASGFSESERVKALQQLGAGAYIRKPYTLESIGVAIRKELSRG
jgi:signal transduction histidine kinase/CHASE2 domain-containing sensor protein